MPQAAAEVFEWLQGELIGIHERWALYRRVFDYEESRIELLNRIADTFFGYTQLAMYLDVILALCRYTDPPGNVEPRVGAVAEAGSERMGRREEVPRGRVQGIQGRANRAQLHRQDDGAAQRPSEIAET